MTDIRPSRWYSAKNKVCGGPDRYVIGFKPDGLVVAVTTGDVTDYFRPERFLEHFELRVRKVTKYVVVWSKKDYGISMGTHIFDTEEEALDSNSEFNDWTPKVYPIEIESD